MSTRPPEFGAEEEVPQAFGSATFEQGPTTPEEEAQRGENLVGQVQSGRASGLMTFDEWMNNTPDIIRARAYDSIGVALMTIPHFVEDHYIEIFAEGYFRDKLVWEAADLWIDPLTSDFRQQKTWDKRFQLWMGTEEELAGPNQTIDTFMELVAAGDPEVGNPGDPTLKGFVRGGSGFQTLKYPLGYHDRKDFMPFLGAVSAFIPGAPLVAAGAGGFTALRAGAQIAPKSNYLMQAMLGQTRASYLLRTVAGIVRKPIVGTSAAIRRTAAKPWVQRTTILGGGTATGFGAFLLYEGVAEPEVVQEIQTIAIAAFQDALTQGDYEEAQVIYDGALYQGFDMGAVGVDAETGEQFQFLTATGETVAIDVPEGVAVEGEPLLDSEGRPITMGGGPDQPTDAGDLITVPGALAANFGSGGVITVVPFTYTEGYDELGPTAQQHVKRPEPLLGSGGDFARISSDYVATRWYPTSDQEQLDWEVGQIRGDPLANFEAVPGGLFRTQEVLPIFRGDDFTDYLTSLDPVMLVDTQSAMIQAGYLDPEGTISGVLFQPGLIDAKTSRAMAMVMVDANANGYQDIREFLSVVKATGQPHTTSGGGGGFRRAPFERRAYLAPDYDTLTQYIKGVVERKIGRKFNDSEMVLAGDQMKQDHRANFDIEEKARRAQYDAAGRGGDPGFIGELIDPEASFAEFFDKTYATEIERRETVEEVYASTQNLFSGLDNAARLIGRS